NFSAGRHSFDPPHRNQASTSGVVDIEAVIGHLRLRKSSCGREHTRAQRRDDVVQILYLIQTMETSRGANRVTAENVTPSCIAHLLPLSWGMISTRLRASSRLGPPS